MCIHSFMCLGFIWFWWCCCTMYKHMESHSIAARTKPTEPKLKHPVSHGYSSPFQSNCIYLIIISAFWTAFAAPSLCHRINIIFCALQLNTWNEQYPTIDVYITVHGSGSGIIMRFASDTMKRNKWWKELIENWNEKENWTGIWGRFTHKHLIRVWCVG